MHGLIFETSVCYWQDQPDFFRTHAPCGDAPYLDQTLRWFWTLSAGRRLRAPITNRPRAFARPRGGLCAPGVGRFNGAPRAPRLGTWPARLLSRRARRSRSARCCPTGRSTAPPPSPGRTRVSAPALQQHGSRHRRSAAPLQRLASRALGEHQPATCVARRGPGAPGGWLASCGRGWEAGLTGAGIFGPG